ncbi:MAG: molybdopterin-dependent oxidoreductase, partial [Rhodoferax sp.]|nr:molybdopterin-dependent oxidoreductase [Rhodoferax sp.]
AAVVLVIATSLRTALDAARAVVVAYRPLPAVTDAALALLDGAPNIWNGIPRNLCFDWQMGDEARVESAIKGASTVVELEITNNRVVVSPLETRAAIGWTDLSSGRRVLITSTQGVHWTRDVIARDVLGWDPDTLDVITPRVGGSFGAKIFVYPEQVLVLLAAERLGVAVKWIGTRDEAFLTDTQGRDHRTRIQLALDGDARFLALRADTTANLGAFLSNYAPFNPTTCGAPLLAGAYKIGCLYTRVKGALSNTPPVDSYRGAGRPEANYALERIIDVAAFKIGMDKVELRRRNLIGPNDFPYTTATGIRLSGGLFLDNLEKAAIAIEYSSYPKRKHRSKANGRLRGIGVANYLEANGGMALARIQEAGGLPRESARITFMPGGSLQVDIGTQSSGQGHRFSYRKILSDHLQIPRAAILVRQGRTDRLRQSTGTGGPKSLLAGSTALLQAGDLVIEKARLWAARSWGVVPQNVAWSEGYFVAKSRRATLLELAEAANDRSGNAHVFSVEACATIEAGTYGNGCHICELEVDPATGEVALLRYVCVNDFGEIVSQRNVKSQVHGGIAQGIGQSLYEDCRFDSCTGRLLTRDFGSYNLPQAKHMRRFEVLLNHGSRGSNRLGIKGCGESGASGAPPAVMNALQDALEKEIGLQATQIQMPATPDRIWNLLNPVLY